MVEGAYSRQLALGRTKSSTLNSAGAGVGVEAAGTTYIYNLDCDDNISGAPEGYPIVNTGTGEDCETHSAWGIFTSTLHSATAYSGTGSFLMAHTGTGDWFSTPVAWTSEKFEIIWWGKLVNATAPNHEQYLTIGDGTLTVPDNSLTVYRLADDVAVIRVAMKGNGGSNQIVTSTAGFSNDTASWHKYTLTVDASNATWTMTLKQDLTTITFDAAVSVGTAATFGATSTDRLYFGGATSAPDFYYDSITVEDKT